MRNLLLYPVLFAVALFFVLSHIVPVEMWFYRMLSRHSGEMEREVIDCVDPCPDPVTRRRVTYGAGPGTVVYGHPAGGGIFVLDDALGVELDFLGLDRFHASPEVDDSDTEEAHCRKMKQLGAQWWKTELDYELDRLQYRSGNEAFVRVGYPAGGGMWVLNTTLGGAQEKGAAVIQNAYNMEERCQAIEQLGGVYYADPDDCPDLDPRHWERQLLFD